MWLRLSLVVAALVSLVGCAASAPMSPARTSTSKQHMGPRECTARLVVHSVSVRRGCTIDERVTQAPGQLTMPCRGAGPVRATFGASVFAGEVNASGEIDLAIETGFDFTDGCHWTTKQRIRGRVGESAWSYEYREEADPGQSRCAAGCVASAEVRVEP